MFTHRRWPTELYLRLQLQAEHAERAIAHRSAEHTHLEDAGHGGVYIVRVMVPPAATEIVSIHVETGSIHV
jgi:hypothetical protein